MVQLVEGKFEYSLLPRSVESKFTDVRFPWKIGSKWDTLNDPNLEGKFERFATNLWKVNSNISVISPHEG